MIVAVLWTVGVAAVCFVTAVAIGRGLRLLDRAAFGVFGAVLGAGVTFALLPSGADAELTSPLPAIGPREGYLSSNACGACHPGQHASWHDSFHRTMTQVATADAVRAPFDGRVLHERGRYFTVLRDADRFYALELDAEDPRPPEGEAWREHPAARRVIMTTGSHHLQAYWVQSADGKLEQFPFVYVIREGRWIANADSFLGPPPDPEDDLRRYVWAEGCVACHTTGGPWDPTSQGMGEDVDTSVVELGISCEQCHGPGDEHARLNRSPARRYQLHLRGAGDDSIVNPRRLPHEASASVCGYCHAIYPDDESPDDHTDFRPGQRLSDHYDITAVHLTADRHAGEADLDHLDSDTLDTVEAFWRDGSVRVAGREYTSMIRSGCYLEGEMACTSCHSMHDGEPDKQVDPARASDAMCTQCHAEERDDLEAHTHHAPESEGSRCVQCHMPHTSYGLLMATRNHRMDGPTASGAAGRQRPNACNLCHLDRSLGWTADHLAEWYGQPRPTFGDAHESLPAGAVWMLRGDGVQRALAAWHVRWEPAREASDTDGLRPALARLLRDPYSAVRQVASDALRARGDAFEGGARSEEVAADAQPALERTLAFESDLLPPATVDALWADRDDTATSIPE